MGALPEQELWDWIAQTEVSENVQYKTQKLRDGILGKEKKKRQLEMDSAENKQREAKAFFRFMSVPRVPFLLMLIDYSRAKFPLASVRALFVNPLCTDESLAC